jgi:predicted RNase H-like nuclease (RuvC/YqgF family)
MPGPFGPGVVGGGGGYGIGGYDPLFSGVAFGVPDDDLEMRALIEQDMRLEHETQQLAAEVRRQPPSAREALKQKLAMLVQQHFEVRQKRRQLQVERMTEELERLRAAIQRRNESRQAIVEQRMRDLLGEPRDLDF